jgi:hypothetical protein
MLDTDLRFNWILNERSNGSSKEKHMIIECHQCQAKVDAKVVAIHVCEDKDDPCPFQTSLLECPSCATTLVAGEYQGMDDPMRLWPQPEKYVPHEIPEIINGSLEEALKCFRAGAYSASTVMAGRALEGICRHFGTEKTYLGPGILELREKGIIDARLAKWAEELQKARNLSAHASGERVSKEDAQDLLEFLNAIGEYIFVLTKKFEKYMARRARASSRKPVTAIAETLGPKTSVTEDATQPE